MGNKCCTCKESVQELNEQDNLVPPPYSLPSQLTTEEKAIPQLAPINDNRTSEEEKEEDEPTPTFNKAVLRNYESSGTSSFIYRHKL